MNTPKAIDMIVKTGNPAALDSMTIKYSDGRKINVSRVIAHNLFRGGNLADGPLTLAECRAEEHGAHPQHIEIIEVDVLGLSKAWATVRLWRPDGPQDYTILRRYLLLP